MANNYRCPHCKASLNPGTKIVLRIAHQLRRGLALLSPQVGNYSSILPSEFELSEGETVRFSCPVCDADLTSPSSAKLVQLLRLQSDDSLAKVFFSRTYGEHATFVVHDDDLRHYGPDAEHYETVNFFGEGRMGRP